MILQGHFGNVNRLIAEPMGLPRGESALGK
jgi:hypothetical protein